MCPRVLRVTAIAFALTASATTTAARRVHSGVRGQALLGPTCPVQRVDQRCERPYQTTLAIYSAAHHRLVKTFRSHRDGHFRVSVAPGHYTLDGTHRGRPVAHPVDLTVRRGRFTVATLHFDTGIR